MSINITPEITAAYTHYLDEAIDADFGGTPILRRSTYPYVGNEFCGLVDFAAGAQAKPVAALPEAELLPNPDAVFLIFFDDQDCRPQIIVGEAAARHRFKEVSTSYNAHLFGKIESNSRDDKYHTNNVALLAAQAPMQEK